VYVHEPYVSESVVPGNRMFSYSLPSASLEPEMNGIQPFKEPDTVRCSSRYKSKQYRLFLLEM
jgi:hypothetical protein